MNKQINNASTKQDYKEFIKQTSSRRKGRGEIEMPKKVSGKLIAWEFCKVTRLLVKVVLLNSIIQMYSVYTYSVPTKLIFKAKKPNVKRKNRALNQNFKSKS